MRIRILAASVALSTALTTALTACGSSGGGNPLAKPPAVGQTTAGGAATTPAGGATTPSAGATTTAAPGGGGGGGDYCDTVKSSTKSLSDLQANDPTAFLADLQLVAVALKRIAAVAPSDIKASWEALSNAVSAFGEAVTKAGITPAQLKNPASLTPAQIQALQAAGEQLGNADFQKAGEAISAEVKAKCGFDVSD